MRNRSKSYGTYKEQRVGFNPDTCKYYLRNKFGAEIDVDAKQFDSFIETAMIVRNQTRRMRRTS